MKDFIARGSAVIQIKFKTTTLVQPHMPLISHVGKLRALSNFLCITELSEAEFQPSLCFEKEGDQGRARLVQGPPLGGGGWRDGSPEMAKAC